MKIKDGLAAVVAFIGFGLTSGSADRPEVSFLWSLLGITLFIIGLIIYSLGKEINYDRKVDK